MAGLDPVLAALRTEAATGGGDDLLAMPLHEARAATIARWAPWNASPPAGASLRHAGIARPDGSVIHALRIEPDDAGGRALLFVHGGGWTFGSVETHRDMAVRLAIAARAATWSIDYRLAPEHPYPAPLDDVRIACEMLAGRGAFAIAGDSAGAALALSAMIARRDRGEALPSAAALFYGCYTPDFQRASVVRFGDGAYGLSAARMSAFWTNYLGFVPTGAQGLATPGWADVGGLPPIFVHAAGFDLLRDDSEALAARLREAGVDVSFDLAQGGVHGYLQMAARLPLARVTLDRAGTYLRARSGG